MHGWVGSQGSTLKKTASRLGQFTSLASLSLFLSVIFANPQKAFPNKKEALVATNDDGCQVRRKFTLRVFSDQDITLEVGVRVRIRIAVGLGLQFGLKAWGWD